jgi:heme A synthase
LSVVSQTAGFQRLCLLTCAVIFGLIVLGGVVRATDSGLGCPDWPTCHGRLIPEWEKHTLIEYSHRFTASVAGVLVLGIAGWAWRSYRGVPAILYPSLLALALIVVQASLGAVAVLNELPPEVVALHLGLALTILALLALVTATAMDIERPFQPTAPSAGLGRLAATTLVATFALMLAGSYVAGADYGLACGGWPLCNGQVMPEGGAAVQVPFAHRVLALGVGLLLAALVWSAWRPRQRAPFLASLGAAAIGVYGLQALIGAANIWTDLSDIVTAAHLAVGTLLWLLLAVITLRANGLYNLLPRSTRIKSTTSRLATGLGR